MTDKEIIKALECCSTASCISNKCHYEKLHDIPTCTTKLTKDALDLINRQQAKIERLNVDLVGMRGACNSYKMHYDNAKIEIERLNNNISAMATTLSNSAKATRNEAIKEFADRLKGKQYLDGVYVVDVKDIDNLIKEMAGEDK